MLNKIGRIARRYPKMAISFFLALMTIAVYWQVIDHDFINFDDPALIYENPYVKKGVTWEGIQWASSADLISNSPHSDFWIPATSFHTWLHPRFSEWTLGAIT